MIPSPWTGLILALGAYRICRLIGWDDFPPVEAARDWLVGAKLVTSGTQAQLANLTREEPEFVWVYARPLLNHFLHCPFCVGAWLSAALYMLWLWFPTEVLYGCTPLALSAAVGLIAKNLDP